MHLALFFLLRIADHMLSHETSLNKFKRTNITPSIFSDHIRLKLEVNIKRKWKNLKNTWKLIITHNWTTIGLNNKSKGKLENISRQRRNEKKKKDMAKTVLKGNL